MKTIFEVFIKYWKGLRPPLEYQNSTQEIGREIKAAFFAGYCACYNESIRETKDAVVFHEFTTEERVQVEKELDNLVRNPNRR